MNISSVCIQNFRKLYQCHIDFSNDTTLFVGANNSGKTSAMDALGKFLAGRPFAFNDITISNRELINQIGKQWETVACEKPNSLSEWGNLLPSLDVWLNVNPQDIHYVVGIIPTLKWRGGRLGVRLIYQPRKIEGLFTEYREAFFSARETEKAGAAEKKIRLFPNSLCEYLERYFTSSFVVKSYILDPEKFDADSPQETAFGMECLVDNPLTGIIRIDTIGAQRNLSDPEKHDGTDSDRTRLSTKIRSYYDKYLDPEKTPLPEDLEILAATEQARKIFDNNLENKFKPAIKELEELGYPGIANPRITITSKVTTTEMLRHDSAVQYFVAKQGEMLTGEGDSGHKEGAAEAIENNIRKKVIEKVTVNPRYYAKMSEILDKLIEERKQGVLDYAEMLEKYIKLAKDVDCPEDNDKYPESIRKSKALMAIYDNTGEDEKLALRIHKAVKKQALSGFRDNQVVVRRIKKALFEILGDDSEVERIYRIIEKQEEY